MDRSRAAGLRSWPLALAALGALAVYAACTDSYRNGEQNSGSVGPGGPGGTQGQGGGIFDPDASAGCDDVCSNDLTAVTDCYGEVVKQCTADQGCANAQCIDNPCEAAELSKSSYGCDYWALKTALRPQADGACFAAFVANTWAKPVHLGVNYDGQALKPNTFAYIPKIGANGAIDYQPYDDAKGLGVGEVAILFLSRFSGGSSVVDCPMPAALDLETGFSSTGKGKAFHITTDYPVVAYQIVPYGGGTAAVTSATLLLPTSAWDTNYLAVNAYQAVPDPPPPANPYLGYPAMEIVAREATKVTILPKMPIVGGAGVSAAEANKPVVYSLNAGEFLQITQPQELTGSVINSDKAVGVFGAATCMKVPTGVNDCDSGQQQIPPVRALGSEYVAVRYKSRSAAMEESTKWRLVGAVDGTALTWEGEKPMGSPDTINQGQIVELDGPGPFIVRSQDPEHPFYLGGYMTGGAAFASVGDPDWVNVVPPPQYLKRYVLFTDPTYPETSLVVVRTPKLDGTFAPVTLKCKKGELDGWQKLGKYEYTRVNLVTGNFTSVDGCNNGPNEMSSDRPFGVTVWGWGTTQQTKLVSYGYPAGAGFLPINEVKIPTTPK